MKKYNFIERKFIYENFGNKTISEISGIINRPVKSIYNWLRKNNLKKNRRYGEMELFMLENFDVKNVKVFIEDKSLNALRIKKCRMGRKIDLKKI